MKKFLSLYQAALHTKLRLLLFNWTNEMWRLLLTRCLLCLRCRLFRYQHFVFLLEIASFVSNFMTNWVWGNSENRSVQNSIYQRTFTSIASIDILANRIDINVLFHLCKHFIECLLCKVELELTTKRLHWEMHKSYLTQYHKFTKQ